MAKFSVMSDVPNPVFDSNGNPASGFILKAYSPGTTTAISIAINSAGGSPQASITYNAEGKLEVSGNEILPYIDKKHKWGIFANTADAAANTPFYMGSFDNVPGQADEFNNVVDLIASRLTAGQLITTIDYYSTSLGGGATYLVKTAGQAATDGDVIDETGNHTLANGNVAILRSARTTLNYGLIGDDSTDNFAVWTDLDSAGGGEVLPGTYQVHSNISLTGQYIFDGGIFKPLDNTVTVMMTKKPTVDQIQCFDISTGGFFKIASVHNFDVVESIWFGMTPADTTEAVAKQNMRAIALSLFMCNLGATPLGNGVTPTTMMPIGTFTVDDWESSGVGSNVKSYQTLKGVSDSTYLNVRAGAAAMDVFLVNEIAANSVIFDDFQIDGNQGDVLQVNTQNGIVINSPSGSVIYSKIGDGVYIKEMSGHGIKVIGAGMDNSVIKPFLVRDNKLGNLFVSACDLLEVKGKYRSSKGVSNSIVFDSTNVKAATLVGVSSEENGGKGLLVSNINTSQGNVSVQGGSFSRNGDDGIEFDRAFYSSASGGFKAERNGANGVSLLDTDGTSITTGTINGNKERGVIGLRSNDCTIVANNFDKNSDTNVNVFDDITLITCDDSNIQTNTFRNSLSTTRYNIAIDDAASDANLVTNNDFKGAGNTGTLSDAGTGTVTAAGNRT